MNKKIANMMAIVLSVLFIFSACNPAGTESTPGTTAEITTEEITTEDKSGGMV